MTAEPNRVRVTIDTNVLPADSLIQGGRDFDFVVVSVTEREVAGSPYEVHLRSLGSVPETGVWGESTWGGFVWGGEDDKLEALLKVLSNGGFPSPTNRENLSTGQRRQLRDAMILEAHLREGRDLFVTNDKKAFVSEGRREALESLFGVRILTEAEFRDHVSRGGSQVI